MAEEIDVEGLAAEIAAARAEFDRWSHAHAAGAASLKQSHANNVKEARAAIEGLEKRKKALADKAEELRKRTEREKNLEAKLQEELRVLQAEQAEIPARIDEARRIIESESKQADDAARALAGEEALVARRVEDVRRQAEVYRRALALEFERSPAGEELRVCMSCIDHAAPQRRFSFAVRAENGYEITACDPEVPEMAGLLAQLNAKPDDFYAFVRGMRRAFKAHVARGKQAPSMAMEMG